MIACACGNDSVWANGQLNVDAFARNWISVWSVEWLTVIVLQHGLKSELFSADYAVYILLLSVRVCVCVCEREREKTQEKEKTLMLHYWYKAIALFSGGGTCLRHLYQIIQNPVLSPSLLGARIAQRPFDHESWRFSHRAIPTPQLCPIIAVIF